MEAEDWKDKILNSLEGIQAAKPDDSLFERTWMELQALEEKASEVISMPYVRLAAACAVLLLGLNGYVWMNGFGNSSNEGITLQEGEYSSIVFNYNLYSE